MGLANVADGPAQPVPADQRAIWQEGSVIGGETVIAHGAERPKLRQTKSGYFVFEQLECRGMHAITGVFAITYVVRGPRQYRPRLVQIGGAFRPDAARPLGGSYERDLAPFALMARARAPGFAFHSARRHWNIIIFVPNIVFLDSWCFQEIGYKFVVDLGVGTDLNIIIIY